MKRQLFISDMDGTLLSDDSRISPESAQIISALSQRGALITVATARTPATVEPLMDGVDTTPPAIVLTGAAMWDRKSHRFINPTLMPDRLAASVTRICLENGIAPMTYTLPESGQHIEMFIHGRTTAQEQRFIDERSHLRYKHITLLPDQPHPDFHPRTILIFALGPINRIYAVADKLRSVTECSLSAYPDIFNNATGLLEVFAPGVSKASAVTALKKACGADELIVFGDNLNDLPMMAVADRAIAVGNALPQVKEAASEIIGPNTGHSVARYIKEHAVLF